MRVGLNPSNCEQIVSTTFSCERTIDGVPCVHIKHRGHRGTVLHYILNASELADFLEALFAESEKAFVGLWDESGVEYDN